LLLAATVEFPASHVGMEQDICNFEMNVAGTVSEDFPNMQQSISVDKKFSS
jgi:hypothetical protein